MILASLSACATFEGEQPQSPAVRAAKACMKQLKQEMAEKPGYFIDACTNTGVWVVRYRNTKDGTLTEYDFVNRLYAGNETGGDWIPVDAIGGYVEENFVTTQKTLNAALISR